MAVQDSILSWLTCTRLLAALYMCVGLTRALQDSFANLGWRAVMPHVWPSLVVRRLGALHARTQSAALAAALQVLSHAQHRGGSGGSAEVFTLEGSSSSDDEVEVGAHWNGMSDCKQQGERQRLCGAAAAVGVGDAVLQISASGGHVRELPAVGRYWSCSRFHGSHTAARRAGVRCRVLFACWAGLGASTLTQRCTHTHTWADAYTHKHTHVGIGAVIYNVMLYNITLYDVIRQK